MSAGNCICLRETLMSGKDIPKRKLRFLAIPKSCVIEWVSDWVCNFSPWKNSAVESAKQNLAQGNSKGCGWCPNIEYVHSAHNAEKANDTTFDDEKYEVRRDKECPVGKHMTDGTQDIHVVMVLCNQLEALTLDLGDDRSFYLCVINYAVQNAMLCLTLTGVDSQCET